MTPLVSVILLTYNHKNYIEQCLESVVSQITDFPFEIIIGDDCSTDGTTEICINYANKYPAFVVLARATKNLGLPGNLINTLSLAMGKLVIFQDGDDYWINETKLQQQADILINNEQFVACTHNVEVFHSAGTYPLLKNTKSIYSLPDSINGRIFHTNSWMIRKEVLPNFRDYNTHLICNDILMEMKVLEKGNVYFINETFSIWRKHDEGNSVRIPLINQFYNFQALYKRLLMESVLKKNKYLIQHYKQTLKNFYAIFAFEIARRDKKLFLVAILKSMLWQFKTLNFDIKFIPRLLITYFRATSM